MGIDSTEDVDTSELPANNKTPQAAVKSDNQEGIGIPVVVCICLLVALITSFASVYS